MRKSLRQITFRLYLSFFASVLFVFFKLIEGIPRGPKVSTFFLEKVWGRSQKIQTTKGEVYFSCPDWLSRYRAKTLYEKEPETIAFIHSFDSNSIFWDIGANIGIYSIYAGKVKGARTYSFEPSLLNVELLFRNIQLNNLSKKITIIPIALSNKTSILDLYMSKNDLRWAGAHNSMGSNTSFTGDGMTRYITSSQISCTGQDMVEVFELPIPSHIKIDVDGLEGDVIEGLGRLVKEVSFILVEVDYSNKLLNKQVERLMESHNFIRLMEAFNHKYSGNQLWKNSEK